MFLKKDGYHVKMTYISSYSHFILVTLTINLCYLEWDRIRVKISLIVTSSHSVWGSFKITPDLVRSPFSPCVPFWPLYSVTVPEKCCKSWFLGLNSSKKLKVYQILQSWCSWIYNQKTGKINVIEVGFCLSAVKYILFEGNRLT